jgi:hypothetical protein
MSTLQFSSIFDEIILQFNSVQSRFAEILYNQITDKSNIYIFLRDCQAFIATIQSQYALNVQGSNYEKQLLIIIDDMNNIIKYLKKLLR